MWDEITYLFPNFKVGGRWWNGRSERATIYEHAIQYFLTHSVWTKSPQFADAILKSIFLNENFWNYF